VWQSLRPTDEYRMEGRSGVGEISGTRGACCHGATIARTLGWGAGDRNASDTMYNYEEPSMFSGRKGLIFLVVCILHVIVGYAFYSGLARRITQTIIPPVEIAQIDKQKADDKPPPPPPKLEDIKPYVPPPEFVDIQAPTEITNAITQTTQTRAPAPVVAVQHSHTAIRVDPKHPLHIGEEY